MTAVFRQLSKTAVELKGVCDQWGLWKEKAPFTLASTVGGGAHKGPRQELSSCRQKSESWWQCSSEPEGGQRAGKPILMQRKGRAKPRNVM